jgi:hypothetical protein
LTPDGRLEKRTIRSYPRLVTGVGDRQRREPFER